MPHPQAVTAAVRPGPNALLPCGSDSARRRHLSRAELCVVCEPDLERSAVCPDCAQRVTVRGVFYEQHDVEGTGVDCLRSGRLAVLPRERRAA